MPQLNPIPWVFFFLLAWSVFLFLSLSKFSETQSPVMNQDTLPVQTEGSQTNEFPLPW
uniref:ATP synthase complex subunit 8 n=1 Tax=Asymmetron sp. A TK-2007 TaxID=426588 RepID=A7X7E2_9BRAN|nr:ATP synthase F0 subunit 8 [Asymmetron sp. A TK-2007]BAF76614.1 ATP synthase subunit 8 [Asymmetron sp. A TK-2007]